MAGIDIVCPQCGAKVSAYRNPTPTVDIIIEYGGGIVLISRKNPPHGWAIPGGFVDYGESLEAAAVREAAEETGLTVNNLIMLHAYSDPARDPRQHTITTVFIATGAGNLTAADDAADARIFALDDLPANIVFDHARILDDYRAYRQGDCSKGMAKI